MERYNYLEALVSDIKGYISGIESLRQREYETTNEYRGRLYDELVMSDSITGNASGAYTSQINAEEYLCHNWDLIREVLDEVSNSEICNLLYSEGGAQRLDVMIRDYLLREAIDIADDELVAEELREYFDSEEEA